MSEKKKSTFGLRLEQLADLFAIATKDKASQRPDGADDDLAEKLRYQLTEVMPGKSLLFAPAPETTENNQFDMTTLTGRSLKQVLFSPETNVGQLQLIKEVSKLLTTTAISQTERAIATTIYHGAIASCLIYHDKKITQHSYEKLDESFALLMEKAWMIDELVKLFSKARHICQKNGARNESQ